MVSEGKYRRKEGDELEGNRENIRLETMLKSKHCCNRDNFKNQAERRRVSGQRI